jgi:ABC-2 type transport system permease protein
MNIHKWVATMRISFSELLAFRFNFFLQVIGPGFVFFFVKYYLWSYVFGHAGQPVTDMTSSAWSSLQGYQLDSMIRYQFWVMVVALLSQGHTSMNLSEDIRMGRISTYLIYPFNFWEFHTASFLSFFCLQFFISSLVLVCGQILLPFSLVGSMERLGSGLIFCFLVSWFWFLVQYTLGLMSFWLEETWVLRVIFLIIAQFLSGGILPLEFFPSFWRDVLYYTPFPYMTYFPVKWLMGDSSYSYLQSLIFLSLWMVIFFFLAQWIWKKGMKEYTASGM